jgi:hypothetical protein
MLGENGAAWRAGRVASAVFAGPGETARGNTKLSAIHPVQRETRRRNLRGGFREGFRLLESPD